MGGLSPIHWMLVLLVVVLLFGTGRLSSVMGDFAKGIKAFKKGMSDDETETAPKSDAPIKTLDHQAPADIKGRAKSESKV